MNVKKIGWIGLGNMGSPMATNLLKAGYEVFVFNRNKEKTTSIVEQGAKYCSTIAELVENTDIIFTMLPDDNSCKEVFKHIFSTDVKAKTFVNSSTISPNASKELNEIALSMSSHYIEAPVSGSVIPAKQGNLSFLIGCSKEEYENILPYLRALGNHFYHLGEVGVGSNAKLAINYYMSILINALGETVLFAEENGISRELMLNIINEGACASPISKIKANPIISDDYPVAFPLKFMLKDILLAKAEDWNTELINTVANSYQKAVDNNLGELDLMAVIKTIK